MDTNEIREETARLRRVGRVLDEIRTSGRRVEEVRDDEILTMLTNYEVVVPATGDRAEAETLSAALSAAGTLIDDAARVGYNRRLVRQGVVVTRGGIYDGAATAKARVGLRLAPQVAS